LAPRGSRAATATAAGVARLVHVNVYHVEVATSTSWFNMESKQSPWMMVVRL
jgi:hypothetical protein